MQISEVKYLGELRNQCAHLRSGEQILTDAPLDNHGKGEAFSPTDLCATSLAACMLTIMGIAAEKHGVDPGDIEAEVGKSMADQPRRIEKIEIRIRIGNSTLETKSKRLLETAARNCPVAKSLHPDLIQDVRFEYGK